MNTYQRNIAMNPRDNPDVDPRPKTRPCHKCARDVTEGQRCMCVASKPYTTHDEHGNRRPFVITH